MDREEDLIELGEKILQRIKEDETVNPLKCSIHYRDAADLLPDILNALKFNMRVVLNQQNVLRHLTNNLEKQNLEIIKLRGDQP